MARNASVQRFRSLMRKLPKAIQDDIAAEVNNQGNRLANVMRLAVAKGVDGRNELLESIRVEPGKQIAQVYVKAGGTLTTKEVRKGSGVEYDYANANEFGTQKMNAQPFFWPSYRLLKPSIRKSIKAAAKKAIGKIVPIQ